MQIYLTQERLQELAKELYGNNDYDQLAKAESVLRLTAEEAVISYRKWLQRDSGAD
jgi:hypothetical protein